MLKWMALDNMQILPSHITAYIHINTFVKKLLQNLYF